MAHFVIYKTATGEITHTLQCSPDDTDFLTENTVASVESYLQYDAIAIPAPYATHYVDTGVLVPKLVLAPTPTPGDPLAVSDEDTGAFRRFINGVPAGLQCSISVPSGADSIPEFTTVGDSIRFEAYIEGEYILTFSGFPYLSY